MTTERDGPVALHDLLDEFRERANAYQMAPTDTYEARRETWERAADELEEALDDA